MYNKKFRQLQHKDISCFECGFLAEDLIQLDIAFRDGNPANKDRSNILSVCANCNRLRKKRLREENKQLDMSVDSDLRI